MKFNDEELLYLTRQGCPVAQKYLINHYYDLITVMTRNIVGNGNEDRQDFLQGAMINLYSAFDNYRNDRNCRLSTYASKVVKNYVVNRYRNFYKTDVIASIKNISFDDICGNDTDFHYKDIIADEKQIGQSPQRILVVNEQLEMYHAAIKAKLSNYEYEVAKYRLDDYSFHDIAKITNKNIKAVYNAVYRIENKLQY